MGVHIPQLSSAEHCLQLRGCQSTELPAAFLSITELREHRVACSFSFIYHKTTRSFSVTMILLILFLSLQVFSCSGLNSAAVSSLPSVPGHDCDRVCEKEQRYHCVFNLRLETHYNNCSNDRSPCFGDGHPREVTLIADVDEAVETIPANSIVVCHGDEVTVNVFNGLESETCTVHWHGLHMKPFMDNTSTNPQGYTQSA